MIGDFNEITRSFEKKKRRLRSERQMFEFRNTLEECSLNDMGSLVGGSSGKGEGFGPLISRRGLIGELRA